MSPDLIDAHVGRHLVFDSTRAKKELGISFKPINECVEETAQLLIDEGFVKKPN